MTDQSIQTFYRKQFEFVEDLIKNIPNQAYQQLADKIIDQVGKDFQTVLEIGGGAGGLSKELAKRGKDVTMVELVPELCEVARKDAPDNLLVINDDFYTVNLAEKFDLVLYIDGFGLGETADQLKVLGRIHGWLADNGRALIDIYQPYYWQEIDGLELDVHPYSDVKRRYTYDYADNRLVDTWWLNKKPDERYSQSLACYSHDIIFTLAEASNLLILAYYPGGKMDYEKQEWSNMASLNECLSYRIMFEKHQQDF